MTPPLNDGEVEPITENGTRCPGKSMLSKAYLVFIGNLCIAHDNALIRKNSNCVRESSPAIIIVLANSQQKLTKFTNLGEVYAHK